MWNKIVDFSKSVIKKKLLIIFFSTALPIVIHAVPMIPGPKVLIPLNPNPAPGAENKPAVPLDKLAFPNPKCITCNDSLTTSMTDKQSTQTEANLLGNGANVTGNRTCTLVITASIAGAKISCPGNKLLENVVPTCTIVPTCSWTYEVTANAGFSIGWPGRAGIGSTEAKSQGFNLTSVSSVEPVSGDPTGIRESCATVLQKVMEKCTERDSALMKLAYQKIVDFDKEQGSKIKREMIVKAIKLLPPVSSVATSIIRPEQSQGAPFPVYYPGFSFRDVKPPLSLEEKTQLARTARNDYLKAAEGLCKVLEEEADLQLMTMLKECGGRGAELKDYYDELVKGMLQLCKDSVEYQDRVRLDTIRRTKEDIDMVNSVVPETTQRTKAIRIVLAKYRSVEEQAAQLCKPAQPATSGAK